MDDGNNNEAGTFLQQAETVRLVGGDSNTISITELKGDKTIGWDSIMGVTLDNQSMRRLRKGR